MGESGRQTHKHNISLFFLTSQCITPPLLFVRADPVTVLLLELSLSSLKYRKWMKAGNECTGERKRFQGGIVRGNELKNNVRREMRGPECLKGQSCRYVTGNEGYWFTSPCRLDNQGKGSQ